MNRISFTEIEQKVFKVISSKPKTVADITKETKLSRMTVYTNLLRLVKKKLVKNILISGKKKLRFVRSSAVDVLNIADSVTAFLVNKTKKHKNADSYKYSSPKEISKILFSLTEEYAGQKMYAVQNSENWNTWLNFLGKDLTNYHNRLVVEGKLICYTIHTPNFPKSITGDKDILSAYKGRLGNSHVIPELYLKKNRALYIFGENILFVDLDKSEAFQYVNKELAVFLANIFSFVFDRGQDDEFFRAYGR